MAGSVLDPAISPLYPFFFRFTFFFSILRLSFRSSRSIFRTAFSTDLLLIVRPVRITLPSGLVHTMWFDDPTATDHPSDLHFRASFSRSLWVPSLRLMKLTSPLADKRIHLVRIAQKTVPRQCQQWNGWRPPGEEGH